MRVFRQARPDGGPRRPQPRQAR